MKKLPFPIVITCLFAVFLTLASCQRQNVEPPLEDRLVGKWTMDAAIGNYTDYGTNQKDTTWFSIEDYFDFKADGTVSIMANQVSYNGNWKIVDHKLIFTNTRYVDFSGGFDLPILTSSDLQLYYEKNSPPDHYLQTKLNLKK